MENVYRSSTGTGWGVGSKMRSSDVGMREVRGTGRQKWEVGVVGLYLGFN